jgi:hypothetical protein
MFMRHKYLALIEGYFKRHERGGFLVGNVFKFHKNFKNLEGYKKLNVNTREVIDQMIDSGLHIVVTAIRDTTSPRYPGNPQTASNDVELTIALDNGGGRYTHYVGITPDLGTPETYYPNLPPIPDAVIRKNKTNIKPEELSPTDNLSNMTDRGNGKLTRSEINLPSKNKSIPSKSAKESAKVSNYTYKYLDGLR